MMTVRPLLRGDMPAVKRVIDACALFASEMLDGMTSGFFAGACDDVWLTVEDGSPVGVGYVAREPMTDATWNLLLIAVHPDHQGRGLGSALMQHVEALLAANGARLLLVETSGLPHFAQTRAFYHGRGFEEEARIREFYAALEDKVVFRKSVLPVPARRVA